MLASQACTRPSCRLKQELELKQHALSLLQERIQNSESSQLAEAIKQAETESEAAQKDALDARDLKAAMIATAAVSPHYTSLLHLVHPEQLCF